MVICVLIVAWYGDKNTMNRASEEAHFRSIHASHSKRNRQRQDVWSSNFGRGGGERESVSIWHNIPAYLRANSGLMFLARLRIKRRPIARSDL